jgi:hypothetical protein
MVRRDSGGFRMLGRMQIEATPRDRDSLIALLPDYEGDRLPVPFGELNGREIPSPEGVTVRFTGALQYRSVDVAPLLTFLLAVAAGVPSSVSAQWIVDRFRGRAERVTINRRIIDLDDDGQIRRIVEEESRADIPSSAAG